MIPELVKLIPNWLLVTSLVSLVVGLVLCFVIATFRLKRICFRDTCVTFGNADAVTVSNGQARTRRVGTSPEPSLSIDPRLD
jgi:hypothetical protein